LIRFSAATFGLLAALLLAGAARTGGSELLANGGFEQGSSGWSLTSGLLETVGSPVHSGVSAGRFSGSGQPTTQIAYQFVDVQPAQTYELSGWIAASGDAVSGVFLRISWFDANGQPVLQDDSLGLAQRDGNFYPLTTGARVSPAAARSARTSLYILGNPGTPFEVHLDDFAFSGPAAIPPPPPTLPPAPTQPPVVTPTPQPPGATPTRTPRRTTTPAPQQTDDTPGNPPPTPETEPLVFDQLVNGGFEQVRSDGTPYGWRKQGGEMSTVSEPRTGGSRGAALASQTTSTKWLYQTVTVRGGAHYEASVDARAGPGSESVFLRVSWYGSSDGSGPAIDSVDSVEIGRPADASFKRLTTGVVEAPPGAGTAKVRLMFRPASEAAATAYFDSAALVGTSADVLSAAESAPGGAVSAAGRRGGRIEPAAGADAEARPAGGTPLRLANVKPAQRDGASPLAVGGGGDEWAVLLAIGVAATAIGMAGGYEFWQRRHRSDIAAGED
jgi:hypothetical protein